MKLAWIYVISALLILATCESDEEKPKDASRSEDKVEGTKDPPKVNDTTNTDKTEEIDPEEGPLPILPPIILLDFINGSDASGDEKSKRTVNGNVGYGFERNNLFSGKYNYYFPAGKTGTTVSIEESISPFQPKTIIESVKPITERPQEATTSPYAGTLRQDPLRGGSGSSNQPQALKLQYQDSPLVFGQRTKLQKTTPTPFGAFQGGFSTTKPAFQSYTTPRTVFKGNSYSSGLGQGAYTTARPLYEEFQSSRPSYSGPSAGSYDSGINAEGYSTPRPHFGGPTTLRPEVLGSAYSPGSPIQSFGNLPRYTYENGVKYEHKIVWKYPDGKISDLPPVSYSNTYSQFPAATKTNHAGYQGQGQTSGFQNVPNSQYSSESLGNIYSQRPAQFPDDQNSNHQQQSQFVSSASSGASSASAVDDYDAASRQRLYEMYQSRFPQRSKPFNAHVGYSTPSSGYRTSVQQDSKNSQFGLGYEEEKPPSKYAVDSPDPEYTFPGDGSMKSTTSSSGLYTPSGQLSPTVLSKYSPQVQRYLSKVFPGNGSSFKHSQDSTDSASLSNLQYSNLLNYNPSISQYIRDPSSILNAQPTFIQAGNSLIPVIILRVDGVAPVHQKPTPNINLKALLQQYLSQYANNVNEFSQGTNYEFGDKAPQSPLYELTQLTQGLKQYSRNQNFASSFAQKFAQNIAGNSPEYEDGFQPVTSSYTTMKKPEEKQYQGLKRMKIKSVQIVEDPRFTGFKGRT